MEVELQYLYCADEPQLVVPTELAHLTLADSQNLTIVDTYFDTSGPQLRRNGCSLRVRSTEKTSRSHVTWKGPSRRRREAKRRAEIELPIESVPADGADLEQLLRRHGIWEVACKNASLTPDARLQPIGVLRTSRSAHTYVHGLHRLELSWDRIEYPLGPDELRVELEAKSRRSRETLRQADEELRALFGESLVTPRRGKVRELCERLYPELRDAARRMPC